MGCMTSGKSFSLPGSQWSISKDLPMPDIQQSPCYSKRVPQTRAEMQREDLLSPTYSIQICIWPRSQSGLHAHWHLRNTVPQLLRKTQADLEHIFSKKLKEGWVCHRTWLNVTRNSWPIVRAREKCWRILLNSAAIHNISLNCLEPSTFEVFR